MKTTVVGNHGYDWWDRLGILMPGAPHLTHRSLHRNNLYRKTERANLFIYFMDSLLSTALRLMHSYVHIHWLATMLLIELALYFNERIIIPIMLNYKYKYCYGEWTFSEKRESKIYSFSFFHPLSTTSHQWSLRVAQFALRVSLRNEISSD